MLTETVPHPLWSEVFDDCLILHAEHTINASTFAGMVTASTLADPYTVVASSIGALKGPLHGGANEEVVMMLREIGTPAQAQAAVEARLQGKNKLMGFGHRVYKGIDPRAVMLKGHAEALCKARGMDQLFETETVVERELVAAMEKQGKKIYPNVDFYSGIVAPQKIADTLGAEILRLWVAATDYSGELSISDEILKRVVESFRRIRNTLRFLLANTADFDAGKDMLPVDRWLDIDRYALALARELQEGCVADYERYEFHRVVQALQTFCSEDLGGFYLDILKDRLYTTAPDSRARRSAQSALWHILQSFTRLMAPILSFTAEEIWQVLTGDSEQSVMLQVWHELPKPEGEGELLARWASMLH